MTPSRLAGTGMAMHMSGLYNCGISGKRGILVLIMGWVLPPALVQPWYAAKTSAKSSSGAMGELLW